LLQRCVAIEKRSRVADEFGLDRVLAMRDEAEAECAALMRGEVGAGVGGGGEGEYAELARGGAADVGTEDGESGGWVDEWGTGGRSVGMRMRRMTATRPGGV
jgi:hypothetical protein